MKAIKPEAKKTQMSRVCAAQPVTPAVEMFTLPRTLNVRQNTVQGLLTDHTAHLRPFSHGFFNDILVTPLNNTETSERTAVHLYVCSHRLCAQTMSGSSPRIATYPFSGCDILMHDVMLSESPSDTNSPIWILDRD